MIAIYQNVPPRMLTHEQQIGASGQGEDDLTLRLIHLGTEDVQRIVQRAYRDT